ncbi:unnamed protein product [Mytilus coruscus]|uniref:Uncharacterized protein n=1 Tax=Mytilus coruscus TaxID=42192 RepID=A0A6J8A8K8_MYTCO|nr:unnamed protein product [Mytilus coruscus]
MWKLHSVEDERDETNSCGNVEAEDHNLITHLLHHIPESYNDFGPLYDRWLYPLERANSWITRQILQHGHEESTVVQTYRNLITHLLHHIPESYNDFGPLYDRWLYPLERANSWITRQILQHGHEESTVVQTYRCLVDKGPTMPVIWEQLRAICFFLLGLYSSQKLLEAHQFLRKMLIMYGEDKPNTSDVHLLPCVTKASVYVQYQLQCKTNSKPYIKTSRVDVMLNSEFQHIKLRKYIFCMELNRVPYGSQHRDHSKPKAKGMPSCSVKL